MKKLILSCLLLVIISGLLPLRVMAQCVYTYTANRTGNFYDPSTLSPVFNKTETSTCSTSTPGTIISVFNINGFAITLDASFTVTPGSSFNITNGGSLTVANGSTLTISDGGQVNVGDNGDLYVSSGGIVKGTDNVLVNSLVVDSRGGIAVAAGGVIDGGNILLGNGKDSFRATNLIVDIQPTAASSLSAAGNVKPNQITVDKATVTVGAGAYLNTKCNLILKNAVLKIEGTILVNGNLDLIPGANVADCGTGLLAVRGCVFAAQGEINQLTATCNGSAAPPKICVAQTSVTCPGSQVAGATCAPASSQLANAAACRALPVELISFTALPTTRQTVQLRWATASEKNNASFTVEHSANGKAFSSVRTVPGAGNTQARTDYELADEHPMPGMSYYRLRQTDIDGTTSYSPVRSVKLSSTVGAMEVYPGHSAQEWVVSSTLPAELLASKAAAVQVFDALGRVQKVEGTADDSATGRWALDLHTLPAGIYIVRLLTSSGAYSQRIAK